MSEATLPLPRQASAPFAAYGELAKPGIVSAVLMTATGGYLIGSRGNFDLLRLTFCLAGTALSAAGAGALNMLIERASDAVMHRTQLRPLPSGRLSPSRALAFGALSAALGVAVLSILSNPAAGAVAATSLALYLFIYTPLKRVSAWCMVPGSVSGALPPLIGYAAATGRVAWPGLTLFAILFLWQFPHIIALGWLYREDYERAGLKMLPAADALSAFAAAAPALLLVPVSVLPM